MSRKTTLSSEDERQARRQVAKANDRAIGRRLKQARVNAGISQAGLGGSLGVSFQSVQRYENGVTGIDAGRLIQAAGVLRTSLTFFFQDLIDLDGYATRDGEIGGEHPAPLSRDAHIAARAFDAIHDRNERAYLLCFIERVAQNSGEETR